MVTFVLPPTTSIVAFVSRKLTRIELRPRDRKIAFAAIDLQIGVNAAR
jgi:hypothetical protein